MDPLTIAGLVSAGLGAIPSIKQAFSGPPEYTDPTSEAFRRRRAALQTQIGGPQTQTAFTGAEKATFGALAGAGEVGREQAALAEALRAQAEGRTPSLAAAQYAQALEQSQAAAASQIASARGLSPAQAQRLALAQSAGARAGAASQSAQIRLQEQMAAQAALGNLLGQRRQQELLGGQLAAGLYGTAGGLGTQQAITQAELNQRAQQMALGIGQQQQELETRQAASLAGAGGTLGQALIEAGRKNQPATQPTQTAQATPAVSPATPVASLDKNARGREITPRVVPGKAKFKGDTRANDTVPALLSPGEIVIPRSVAQDEDAPEKTKKFVEAIKGKKRASPRDYAQALARLKELEARMDAMETLADLEAESEG